MILNIPNSYDWFSKLKLTKFIPWNFDEELNLDSLINERFKIECNQKRQVVTFGCRQDTDTYVGFEIIDGIVSEKIIVFHPTYNDNNDGWDIIESEHLDFFAFMTHRVLPEMKEWISEDDVNDYL